MKCSKCRSARVSVLDFSELWSSSTGQWYGTPRISPRLTIRNTHTLATGEAFGFDGKKQLEQTLKTVGKGLRDGADLLDEQETNTALPFHGRNSAVRGARQTKSTICHEGISEIHVGPTCKYYSEAPVLNWKFPYQAMPNGVRAQSRTRSGQGALNVVRVDTLWWSSVRGVLVYAADGGAVDRQKWNTFRSRRARPTAWWFAMP